MDKNQAKLVKSLEDMDTRTMRAKRLFLAYTILSNNAYKVNHSKYSNFFGLQQNLILNSLILELSLIFDEYKPKWADNINLNEILAKIKTCSSEDRSFIDYNLQKAQKIIDDEDLKLLRDKGIAHVDHNRPITQKIPLKQLEELIELAQDTIKKFRKILKLPPMIEPRDFKKFDPALKELTQLVEDIGNKQIIS